MTMRLRPVYAFCALTLIAALAALTTRLATWESGLAEMRIQGGDRLALHRQAVEAAVERFRYLPFLLSQDSGIREILKQPDNSAGIEKANHYLESAAIASGASALYVLDMSGLTLAASNYAQPTSFVGHSYAFRPYFQDAIKTGQGRFYAIGVTTREPGYFLSHVIKDGVRALGVAVVKIDLRPLETAWRSAGEMVAVVDGAGILFLASNEDWTYRPLRTLGVETLRALGASKQYDSVDLGAHSLVGEDKTPQSGDLVGLQTQHGGQRSPVILFHSLLLPDHDWMLISTSDVTPLRQRANLVAATTALALAFAGLIGLFLRQRRQLIRAKLEAHDILEERVEERTSELRAVNLELARQIDVRKSAENDLKCAQYELIQAAKLAALGQMSAAIVHEVSQPLAGIETYLASTRVLLQRGAASAAAANIEIINDLVARMRRMARGLKAFARKEEIGTETIDINAAFKDAVSVLRTSLEAENITLKIETVSSHSWVAINSVRAEQIFINLLGNAIDAVRDRNVKLIQVTLENEGEYLKISISDTGHGIPDHLRGRIGEAFVTSKKIGDGLGLGLFICDAIINDAGGNLSAANGQDGGAVFTVLLPLSAPQMQRAAE